MTPEGPVLYDEEADALYVLLSDAAVDHSKSLDDLRIVDYGADGAVVGVEFINASAGIDLSEVPSQRRVEELIAVQAGSCSNTL